MDDGPLSTDLQVQAPRAAVGLGVFALSVVGTRDARLAALRSARAPAEGFAQEEDPRPS